MAQWIQTIRERNESSETINDYCERIGVSRDAYYYWQRIIRKAACRQLTELTAPQPKPLQTFTEAMLISAPPPANLPGNGQIRIEAGSFSLTADSSYPVENIAALISAVVQPC
jgi:hypothetical protein